MCTISLTDYRTWGLTLNLIAAVLIMWWTARTRMMRRWLYPCFQGSISLVHEEAHWASSIQVYLLRVSLGASYLSFGDYRRIRRSLWELHLPTEMKRECRPTYASVPD
ncbi:hypothetical protein M758_4G034100 [Ceratodon purpureus]|nr:hypothetical protein M758_4G034100 [Ceratodon purpureus]